MGKKIEQKFIKNEIKKGKNIKMIKTFLKSFSTSRIDFSAIQNILSPFKVSLSRNEMSRLLRFLNSNIEIMKEDVFQKLPHSIDKNIKYEISNNIFDLKSRLKMRGEDVRSVIESHLKIMNIYINHIYNFLNLHYLKACEKFSQNKPNGEGLADYIPALTEQFIMFISQVIYCHSEKKFKRILKLGNEKRNAKISSLKEKMEHCKKGRKSLQKMMVKLGKLELLNTEFYMKLPNYFLFIQNKIVNNFCIMR